MKLQRQHFLLSYFKILSVFLQLSNFSCGTIRTVTNNHSHGLIGGDGMLEALIAILRATTIDRWAKIKF